MRFHIPLTPKLHSSSLVLFFAHLQLFQLSSPVDRRAPTRYLYGPDPFNDSGDLCLNLNAPFSMFSLFISSPLKHIDVVPSATPRGR